MEFLVPAFIALLALRTGIYVYQLKQQIQDLKNEQMVVYTNEKVLDTMELLDQLQDKIKNFNFELWYFIEDLLNKW